MSLLDEFNQAAVVVTVEFVDNKKTEDKIATPRSRTFPPPPSADRSGSFSPSRSPTRSPRRPYKGKDLPVCPRADFHTFILSDAIFEVEKRFQLKEIVGQGAYGVVW